MGEFCMTNETRSQTPSNLSIQLVTVLVVGLSFWFVLSQLDSSEIDITETLSNANSWLLAAFLCIIALTTISPLLWKVLMYGSGANIPLKTCYGLWWTTNIAKYIPASCSKYFFSLYIVLSNFNDLIIIL